MSTRTPPHRAGVLMGAGLTLAFGALATLIASLLRSPSVMLWLTLGAFTLAGIVTLRLRSGTPPVEPALGAAGAVLLFSFVQIALMPGLREELGWGRLVLSTLVSVAVAYSLAWLGAMVVARRERGPRPEASAGGYQRWRRTGRFPARGDDEEQQLDAERPEPRAPARTDRGRLGADPPDSRPAPQSGGRF